MIKGQIQRYNIIFYDVTSFLTMYHHFEHLIYLSLCVFQSLFTHIVT